MKCKLSRSSVLILYLKDIQSIRSISIRSDLFFEMFLNFFFILAATLLCVVIKKNHFRLHLKFVTNNFNIFELSLFLQCSQSNRFCVLHCLNLRRFAQFHAKDPVRLKCLRKNISKNMGFRYGVL